MSILKTIAKGICGAVAIIAGFMLVMFVILTICWGPFGGGADSTKPQVTTTPTVTPTPEPVQDPNVEDRITTRFSGQEIHVKCKVLVVPTDGGTIYIENDDIEVISVIGNGNMIAYPSSANPEIRDVGSYNEIWGSIWI